MSRLLIDLLVLSALLGKVLGHLHLELRVSLEHEQDVLAMKLHDLTEVDSADGGFGRSARQERLLAEHL